MFHATIAASREVDTRRREPRAGLEADVALRAFGATAVDARLLNISSHGFMAETDAEIGAGNRIWLTLPGGTRANALVIWTRGARLGGEFLAPIDPLAVITAAGHAQHRS